MSIDLDRVGIDGEIDIDKEEKAERVKILLDTMQYLYRDIKGRRENLSPLFVIGGRYSRKNPFFENRVKVDDNKINVETLQELINLPDILLPELRQVFLITKRLSEKS